MSASPASHARPGHHVLSRRHYGMDWLRIGAFGLLILYHVGLAFSEWPYEFKATRTYAWTAYPLLLLNAWRLSLLFAISGYASAAILERAPGTGSFLQGRLARLGIPLLFAMAVVVTPQPWIWLTMAQGYDQGFGWFLLHDYFSFRNIDGIRVPAWMHMWFVVYLLAYTGVLCALRLLPGKLRRGTRWLAERAFAGPLLLPLGVALTYAARRLPHEWTDAHDFIDDAAAHCAYFGAFLFGVLLRNSEKVRLAIARQWKIAAMLSLVGYAVVAGCELRFPGDIPVPRSLEDGLRLGRAAQGWGAIVALFGVADLFWNREGRWRATLAEAVFPFFIIHQTLIFVIGFALRPLAPTPLTEFVALTLGTAAGCVLFYRIGRRIDPLRPLIGLKRHSKRPTAPIEPPRGADPSEAPG
jgi:glucans biosynthesis protein C